MCLGRIISQLSRNTETSSFSFPVAHLGVRGVAGLALAADELRRLCALLDVDLAVTGALVQPLALILALGIRHHFLGGNRRCWQTQERGAAASRDTHVGCHDGKALHGDGAAEHAQAQIVVLPEIRCACAANGVSGGIRGKGGWVENENPLPTSHRMRFW